METNLYAGATRSVSLTGPIHLATIFNAVADVEIREIGFATVSCTAATSPEVGLGRPAVLGVGNSGNNARAEDIGAVASGGTQLCVNADWLTSTPTQPTVFMRRYAPCSATTSASPLTGGIAWTWDVGEFIMRAGEQVTLWLIAGTSTIFDIWHKVRVG
jgi:hypothetical protein